ncbi:MAG: endolytic transglycosylase MltG [Actinobacteria bacterium]|nr:MAG: endolytic transglycosylase MltG [Actinomycetota bacterium]
MIDDLDIPFEDYERGRHRRRRGGRGAPQARGGRPRRRRGRSLFALFITLVLLGALAAGGWYGVGKIRAYLTVPDYSGDGDTAVMVHIAPDDSGKDMADKLYQANVVKSQKAFVNAFNANPQSKTIEVGYYKLRQHMKASKALDALLARNPDHTLANRVSSGVTITEGEISTEVFAALAKATNLPVTDFQNAAKDPVALGVSPDWFTRQDGKPVQKSIEGFLYPATYEFDPGVDATAILKKIIANFNAEMTKLDFLNQVQATLHISPFEALIAASIAQVEGRFPDDMAGIARVLYNRAYGGKFPCACLQLDSTVNYWLRVSGQTPKSSKDLTVSDLHNPNDPYNTHDKPGLPIGPISNPGEDALKAAMSPPKSGYLYFVAIDKEGHTAFATTEQEHAANIALAKKNGVL